MLLSAVALRCIWGISDGSEFDVHANLIDLASKLFPGAKPQTKSCIFAIGGWAVQSDIGCALGSNPMPSKQTDFLSAGISLQIALKRICLPSQELGLRLRNAGFQSSGIQRCVDVSLWLMGMKLLQEIVNRGVSTLFLCASQMAYLPCPCFSKRPSGIRRWTDEFGSKRKCLIHHP